MANLAEYLPAGDGCLDDLLHDIAPEGLKGHLLRVLDRDNNGVNPDWHAGAVVEVIFTSDLRRCFTY